MKITRAGIELIKKYEGLKLERYICPGGYPTIGYGSRLNKNNTVNKITKQQAEEMLSGDLKSACNSVDYLVSSSLNDNQYSALVSFVFNLGHGNFASSTLLEKINNEEYLYAPIEFLKWIHVNQKPLLGLARRRADEAVLFLS